MRPRIGLFLCKCGTNIAESIDLEELERRFRDGPAVADVSVVELACADSGREQIRARIADAKLDRIVVAACSPKQHEATFQKVMKEAGRNPFFSQIVNIREQIAWVTPDRAKATEKAAHQIRAAIARVERHEPLEPRSIECRPDVLVVGAGVAGLTAALTLAQKARKVYVVEREFWIGGRVTSYEDVFPNLECAPCMMEPKLDHALHDERIEILTGAEVAHVAGYFGHFDVKVKKRARRVDPAKCYGCGACYDACPVKVPNAFDGGLSERHAVHTAYAGMLPNVPAIDPEACLRVKGGDCRACADACAFEAFDFDEKDSERLLEVGAIVLATGLSTFAVRSLPGVGAGIADLYDNAQFERILSSTGPTGGKVLTREGKEPEAIAFVHCAGSRSEAHKEYCSGVCCADVAKMGHLVHAKTEGRTRIVRILRDLTLPGRGRQKFEDKYMPKDARQIRVADPNTVTYKKEGDRIRVDWGCGSELVDMAVLASAVVPAPGAAELAAALGCAVDRHGFIVPEHDLVAPGQTAIRGVLVAGCAEGPKDIQASVLQAQAAAGVALQSLVPGERIELETMTALVDPNLCSACRVCPGLCPYQAIRYVEEKGVAEVNDALCKGCGVCVAGCPAGAITNHGFTNDQILSEIRGVLA